MITEAPLELKKYFFPLVHVAADPEYEPGNGQDKVNFDVRTSVTRADKNDIYQVAVEIIAEPEDEDHRIPYSIHLIGIGLFSVSEKWDDPERLLNINGASMIYSAAREFLITVTARGPWNPVILPTISFRSDDIQPENASRKKGENA